MPKDKRIKVILIFLFSLLFMAFFVLVMAYRYPGKDVNQKADREISEEVGKEITLLSNIPGLNPQFEEEHEKYLEIYLNKIHFWESAETAYGGEDGRGRRVSIDKLVIIFTGEFLTQSLTVSQEKEQLFSSNFIIENDTGKLYIYYYSNPKHERLFNSYILNRLYRISTWPKREYDAASKEYEDQMHKLSEGYITENGLLIKI